MSNWEKVLGVEQRRAHSEWLDRGRQGVGRLELDAKDLSGARFGGARLDGARFTSCRMDRLAIDLTTMEDCELVDCTGQGGALCRCALYDVTLERSRLTRFNMSGSDFNQARLLECDFTDSGFERSTLVGCAVDRAIFRGALMRDAFLRGSIFTDCDFRHAELGTGDQPKLAGFADCRFVRCDFRGARLEGRAFDHTVFEACRFHGITGRPAFLGPVVVRDGDRSEAADGSRITHQATDLWPGTPPPVATRRTTEDQLLEAVLESYERYAPPATWGLNRSDGERYQRERVRDFVSRCMDPTMILAWGGKKPRRHETWLQLNLRYPSTVKSVFSGAAHPAQAEARDLYDLGDALVAATLPDFAVLGPLTEGDDEREEDVLGIATNLRSAGYLECGPRGPAVRTYLGPRLTGLVGEQHLAATGCRVSRRGTHVRLDLLPEPWSRSPAELLPRWHAAAQALAASGVFARATAAGKLQPGPRWSPPPV